MGRAPSAQQVQVVGDPSNVLTGCLNESAHRFASGRHFAAWLGLTPREHSSGRSSKLGSITQRGDPYLRTLLIHGARSVLNAALRGQALGRFQSWALEVAERRGHNKAAVELANKIARRLWAMTRDGTPFDGDHVSKMPAMR